MQSESGQPNEPANIPQANTPMQFEFGEAKIPASNTIKQKNTPVQSESGAANNSKQEEIPVQFESGDCIPERTPHTATNISSQGPMPITQEEDWTCKGAIPGDGLRRSKRVKQQIRANNLDGLHQINNLMATDPTTMPDLTINPEKTTSMYGAANHHLQMNELAFQEYFAGAITCKETGQPLEYRDLIKRPEVKEIWEKALSNELGRLAQGVREIKGTDTIFFIKKSEIPKDRLKDVTYGRIVVSYRPQKEEKNRARLTAGGDRINYPFETSAPTCSLPTIKMHFNSVLSTPGAKFDIRRIKLLSWNSTATT